MYFECNQNIYCSSPTPHSECSQYVFSQGFMFKVHFKLDCRIHYHDPFVPSKLTIEHDQLEKKIHIAIPHFGSFQCLILDLINKTSHFPPCPNAASQHCQGYRWRARDLTQAPRDPSHIALGAVGINVTNQQITGSLDYPFWGWEFFTIQMYGKFLRDFPKKTMHWVGLVIYWPPSKRPSFEILRRGCSCRTRRLECRCWCGKRNLGRWLDGRDDYGSWW